MMQGRNYIKFQDPLIEQICATNWGDGVGITLAQAAAVTNIGQSFRYTEAVSFDEFKYFTGVTTVPDLAFANTSKLDDLTLPDTITTISGQAFNLATGLTRITIPASVTRIDHFAFVNNNRLTTVVLLPTIPPTNGGTNFAGVSIIYVPYSEDHSVLAAYQNATNWSTLASKMSELNPDGTIPSN